MFYQNQLRILTSKRVFSSSLMHSSPKQLLSTESLNCLHNFPSTSSSSSLVFVGSTPGSCKFCSSWESPSSTSLLFLSLVIVAYTVSMFVTSPLLIFLIEVLMRFAKSESKGIYCYKSPVTYSHANAYIYIYFEEMLNE